MGLGFSVGDVTSGDAYNGMSNPSVFESEN